MKASLKLKSMSRFLESEWNNAGARVFTNFDNWHCPRCESTVMPNKEHLCGDRVPKTANEEPKARKPMPEAR